MILGRHNHLLRRIASIQGTQTRALGPGRFILKVTNPQKVKITVDLKFMFFVCLIPVNFLMQFLVEFRGAMQRSGNFLLHQVGWSIDELDIVWNVSINFFSFFADAGIPIEEFQRRKSLSTESEDELDPVPEVEPPTRDQVGFDRCKLNFLICFTWSWSLFRPRRLQMPKTGWKRRRQVWIHNVSISYHNIILFFYWFCFSLYFYASPNSFRDVKAAGQTKCHVAGADWIRIWVRVRSLSLLRDPLRSAELGSEKASADWSKNQERMGASLYRG